MIIVAHTSKCVADHRTLKSVRLLWETLPKIGEQHDHLGTHLELRNCTCGSTLTRPLPGHVDFDE